MEKIKYFVPKAELETLRQDPRGTETVPLAWFESDKLDGSYTSYEAPTGLTWNCYPLTMETSEGITQVEVFCP